MPREERRRRKVCRFCAFDETMVDYKDERRLSRFITDRGKIVPRRITGTCARHQRQLTRAIKRARHAGVIAYTSEHFR
jgi:small subunit ribosomal protein S18